MKSPLFRDPFYDGAADPVVIWNRQTKEWWMIYTNQGEIRIIMQCLVIYHRIIRGILANERSVSVWGQTLIH
ncbi:hypothetical protein QFZ77_006386 [Paenibacillus sp. V4I3]|uniref:hypothetical protein n=1 Tax=Paenibacillus sp. V4I3 TaxID=3042305 RepID=UPI002785BAA5|nr:hypothetical protein [Paenibacillus sp. V4I3]MDQ0877727.1 hypothetical protein [Paenibacillus sp. V4I3]